MFFFIFYYCFLFVCLFIIIFVLNLFCNCYFLRITFVTITIFIILLLFCELAFSTIFVINLKKHSTIQFTNTIKSMYLQCLQWVFTVCIKYVLRVCKFLTVFFVFVFVFVVFHCYCYNCNNYYNTVVVVVVVFVVFVFVFVVFVVVVVDVGGGSVGKGGRYFACRTLVMFEQSKTGLRHVSFSIFKFGIHFPHFCHKVRPLERVKAFSFSFILEYHGHVANLELNAGVSMIIVVLFLLIC